MSDLVLERLNKISTEAWGQYLLNKFFIKIRTGKERKDVPSYDFENNTFSVDDQMELQKQNFVALFHEYVHYVHEVSTMVGITTFHFQVYNRGLFSSYVDVPNSSGYTNIKKEDKIKIDKISTTIAAFQGHNKSNVDGRLVFNIKEIVMISRDWSIPNSDETIKFNVPLVTYDYLDNGAGEMKTDSFFFGSYFIYEGLAFLLDQEVALQLSKPLTTASQVDSEYKVLEMIARNIYPEIDKRMMLEIASLSLSYLNCGEWFIIMIHDLATADDKEQKLNEFKAIVSGLLQERLDDLKNTLAEIEAAFEKRQGLHGAVKHLTATMSAGYQLRIANPTFEVDITYSGNLRLMDTYIRLCPLVYEFTDTETYMRDYAGSYFDPLLSFDLVTLLCHVDYYQSSIAKEDTHACPAFTFCSHPIRQNKPHQCCSKPRMAFEDSNHFGFCNYSRAVAYMKATDVL